MTTVHPAAGSCTDPTTSLVCDLHVGSQSVAGLIP